MELNRCAYVILGVLRSRNAIDKVHGLTICEIAEMEQTSKHNTIHKKIKQLQKFGYLDEGIKAGRSKTYFLTNLGIKILPAKKEG